MSSVYVIINESVVAGVDIPITEIVPPARWNYQDALEDIYDIANSADVAAYPGSTSVYLPVKGTHLESDEYYIIELEVEDRG